MRLIYLVGEPGAGKSTLCGVVRNRLTISAPMEVPLKHVLNYDEGGALAYAELGWPDGPFPGTDVYGMSVQPRAVEWLSRGPYPVVLGEGDRLANAGFFGALRAAGHRVTVAWLDTPAALAADRRGLRAEAVGRAQNESWVRGRITKVRNLVGTQPDVVPIGGVLPLDEQAERLWALLRPVRV